MNHQTVKSNNQTYKIDIRDDADESVAAEIFKWHEYERVVPIIESARHGIVDIGAHAGFFTLYARSYNPTVKIVAVEPVEENSKQLTKHLEENNIDHVEIVEGVVAKEHGRRALYTAQDNHNYSIIPNDQKSVVVPAITLSEAVKKCILGTADLVKLDCEGAEYEIIYNAGEETLEKIGAFCLEYHAVAGESEKKLEQFLREHKFKVQRFPSKFDSSMGFLFAHRKHA